MVRGGGGALDENNTPCCTWNAQRFESINDVLCCCCTNLDRVARTAWARLMMPKRRNPGIIAVVVAQINDSDIHILQKIVSCRFVHSAKIC